MLTPDWMRYPREPLPKEEFEALIAEIEDEIVAELEETELEQRAS